MPTVVIQPGLDTYIDSANPAVNYGASQTLSVGNATATTGFQRALLKFDLAVIPANAYIYSSTLYMYYDGTGLTNSLPLPVYTVLVDWTDTQATWTLRSAGNPWDTAGCGSALVDYRSPSSDVSIIAHGVAQWYDWTLTTQTQRWVWGEDSNYGVIFSNYIPTSFNTNTKVFNSSDYIVDPLLCPKLEVVYAIPPDIPTMTMEPLFTQGISNTISWSDESGTGATEYFPQLSTSNDFDENLEDLSEESRVEYISPQTTSVVTTWMSIQSIISITLTSTGTGTDYFTGGSFVGNIITLGTTLPSVGTAVFSGSGLDDLASGGNYTSTSHRTYIIEIDGTGASDTFQWSDDGGSTWTTGVTMTGAAQALSYGVTVTFTATTGHTLEDQWSFDAEIPAVYVRYETNGWVPDRTSATFGGLIDGTKYYYRVKARDAALAETNWSGYVHSTQDDCIDTLELISPIGTEVWDGRFTKIVQWKAVDDSSGLTTNATVSYSGDGGDTWQVLDTSPNSNSIVSEAETSKTKRQIFTDYLIKSVTGVWLATDTGKTGTNFYTGGYFDRREITLNVELPAAETAVIIDYDTYGKYSWALPDNLDSEDARIKIAVEDAVGNTKEIYSDKDFEVITIQNRLHQNVFDITDGTYVDKLMKTYANSNQDISHEDDNVKRGYSIENSEYTDLDLHGVGYDVLRKPGESDRDYRERIIANLTAPKNTKQAILDALQPHVYNAWIFEWMGNWEDDYCFFLDWSFMDYRDYLGGGLGYGDGTDPFTFEVHVRPLMESKTETQPSVGLSTVTTDYSILSVVGVWDNSAKTGTNYYLPVPPGTFSDRTITLGTPLTSHPSTVYVEYVTQEILRKIADVIDKTKPAGTKAYVIIERGAYYGEEVYGVPYYGG